MNTQVKNIVITAEYHECPCCGSKDMDFGDIDTRKEGTATHEWFQYMTCKTCNTEFKSVFRHVYQEILVDSNAKKLLLERIQNNTLSVNDLKLFADMIDKVK